MMPKRTTALLCIVLTLHFVSSQASYDTRGCWTCSPGFQHWFVAGLDEAPGGDQCACVPGTAASSTAAPASYDTRGCWTCSPGYTHWFNAGLTSAPGGDRCACVRQTSTPTTASPTTTTTRSPVTTTTTSSLTTTTTSPTSYDTRGCWTCSPGYTHWFNAGLSSAPGGDKCACVPISSSTTTTRAPTDAPTTTKESITTTKQPVTTTTASPTSYDTRGCWTCPSGWTHWFNAGLDSAPGGDRCACVKISSSPTTNAPTTTTTRAPTSGPTTTTRAPTTTSTTAAPGVSIPSDCWTCPSGWSHWWLWGYTSPPTGDRCQCIQGSPGPVTAAPTNTPTAAPSNALQKFLNLITPNSVSPGGVAFSPYVAPYSPWSGPSLSLIDQLGSILMKQTNYRSVLIYYTEPYMVGSLVKNGFNVYGIISLGADWNNNANLINTAIDTYRKYPNNVVALICGNELGLQLGVTGNTAAIINNCITTVKKASLGIPVGVMDTYTSWTQNNNIPWTAVAQNVDFIGANIYAWWDNVYIPPPFVCETEINGPQITFNNYMKVQNLYPNIPVILTEFGWPSCNTGYSCTSRNVVDGSTCAKANDANQKKFVQGVVDIFRRNQRPCSTFAAFREAWKGTNDADINQHWGVCFQNSGAYTCPNAPV